MRPALVLGASGFIGSHLLKNLADSGRASIGVSSSMSQNWRTTALELEPLRVARDMGQLHSLLDRERPEVIFNLAAFGSYENQIDVSRTIAANLSLTVALADWAADNGAALIQAGSSSEYGLNSNAPGEESARPRPNSLYAVTKLGASLWLEHMCRSTRLQAVTLRLYSVYGPLEDPGRLIPTLIRKGQEGELPPLADASISRDFVFVDDVVQSFLRAEERVGGEARGRTLNICTGVKTTMADLASLVHDEFGIGERPSFGTFGRHWDLEDWVGDPTLAKEVLKWKSTTSLTAGFKKTRSLYELPQFAGTLRAAILEPAQETISIVVACYRDEAAIPHLHQQVQDTFEDLNYDFELIFVNDGSPDNTLQAIEQLSRADSRVIGITHSRNFGSQAAFLSGMKVSSGDYVCLMDGDLQDPPAVIPRMLTEIEGGADVVFGERVGRDAPWVMQLFYKLFYRLFSKLSSFSVPRDAGDFSLMRRNVVTHLAAMPERGLFIRAQRAYVGFTQVGVPYHRPERMFGRSTNNLARNLGWATKGLIASSRIPLVFLTAVGLLISTLSAALIAIQAALRILAPGSAPEGFTTLIVLILGVGGFSIFCMSIIGLYVGRILDEVQARPTFIRRSITRSGVTVDEAA